MTWDEYSGLEQTTRLTFMAIHHEEKDQDCTSSEKSNSEGGASSYESDTVSEVMNLTFDEFYDAIKLLSRSLCKVRDKYISLKKIEIDLENKLIDYSSERILKI